MLPQSDVYRQIGPRSHDTRTPRGVRLDRLEEWTIICKQWVQSCHEKLIIAYCRGSFVSNEPLQDTPRHDDY